MRESEFPHSSAIIRFGCSLPRCLYILMVSFEGKRGKNRENGTREENFASQKVEKGKIGVQASGISVSFGNV